MVEQLPDSRYPPSGVVRLDRCIGGPVEDDGVRELRDVLSEGIVVVEFALLDELEGCDLR